MWFGKTAERVSKLILLVADNRRISKRVEERQDVLMVKIVDFKAEFDAFKSVLLAKLADLAAKQLSAEDQAALDAMDADLKSLTASMAPPAEPQP